MANLFELPKFENEDINVKARLVFLISAGMAIASLTFVIVSLFAMPALFRRALILGGLIIPVNLAIMWLVHSLRVKTASSLLLVVIWLVVTIGAISAGGVSAPITIGYIFAITISGLIMPRGVSLYVMFVSV